MGDGILPHEIAKFAAIGFMVLMSSMVGFIAGWKVRAAKDVERKDA